MIGAGASAEANLPVGSQLKTKIADSLGFRFDQGLQQSGNQVILEAISWFSKRTQLPTNFQEYLNAAKHISSAMVNAISIDNFIDSHSDDEKIEICGKLAIAHEVLEAERSSLLRHHSGHQDIALNFEFVSDTWYPIFFQMLHEGKNRKDIETLFENVKFIIFNYDRCLEHYLFNSIINYYGLGHEDAASLLNEVDFIHPYGQVGELPYLHKQSDCAVHFGDEADAHALLRVSKEIMTYSEHYNDRAQIKRLKSAMNNAQQVVFLGFAYHPQNLKLVSTDALNFDARIYGSALNISENDTEVIRGELESHFSGQLLGEQLEIVLDRHCTARGLLTTYWRSLLS